MTQYGQNESHRPKLAILQTARLIIMFFGTCIVQSWAICFKYEVRAICNNFKTLGKAKPKHNTSSASKRPMLVCNKPISIVHYSTVTAIVMPLYINDKSRAQSSAMTHIQDFHPCFYYLSPRNIKNYPENVHSHIHGSACLSLDTPPITSLWLEVIIFLQ